MSEAKRAPWSRIAKRQTGYLRPRLRGLWSGAAVTAGVASLFLIAGVAQAANVTLLPPYTGAVPILNEPKTWNVGSGFIKWPTATNVNPNSGGAGYDVWARSTGPTVPSTHGSDNTQAGFNITVVCGICAGDTLVTFNWKVTWNATMDLTCNGGSVNNQFGVDGQIFDHAGTSLGFTTTHIWWQSSTTVPTHLTGAATNAIYTVPIGITPPLPPGTYYLHTWLFSEVYTNCPSPWTVGTYANSELNVATPGGQGGTLTSVVIS